MQIFCIVSGVDELKIISKLNVVGVHTVYWCSFASSCVCNQRYVYVYNNQCTVSIEVKRSSTKRWICGCEALFCKWKHGGIIIWDCKTERNLNYILELVGSGWYRNSISLCSSNVRGHPLSTHAVYTQFLTPFLSPFVGDFVCDTIQKWPILDNPSTLKSYVLYVWRSQITSPQNVEQF